LCIIFHINVTVTLRNLIMTPLTPIGPWPVILYMCMCDGMSACNMCSRIGFHCMNLYLYGSALPFLSTLCYGYFTCSLHVLPVLTGTFAALVLQILAFGFHLRELAPPRLHTHVQNNRPGTDRSEGSHN
jgi:hypothetical protein